MLNRRTQSRSRSLIALVCVLLLAAVAVPASRNEGTAQAKERVDLVLVLAVDCSWSVNGAEYQLQIEGMARAFQDPAVLEAIQSGQLKRIAVTVVQWASNSQQVVTMPWQVISSAADAHAVSAIIDAMPRSVSDGGTSITTVLKFSAKMILEAPFSFSRAVIDVATDGRNNNGGDPRPVRDLIGGAGITVNGLTILTEFPNLQKYFDENITTGPYRFVVSANSYAGYARAIRKKLLKEIKGPPIS
ncbi:MAG: DUF1194 domain-containing protein [Hyphomicrobiaceae bacterium]